MFNKKLKIIIKQKHLIKWIWLLNINTNYTEDVKTLCFQTLNLEGGF